MLGPNGAGKSTLLRTLAGLQPALAGEISFPGAEAQGEPIRRERLLSLVLTERLSLDRMTIRDVVAMGRYPYTTMLAALTTRDEQVITESLASVGIQPREADDAEQPVLRDDTLFSSLSDGERQRVMIAKALAQTTPIILLDEPTAHLDLPNRIRIFQLLRRLSHEQGKTILISTHELDLALQMADRVLLVSPQGVQLATAEKLLAQDAFTQAFGLDIFHPLR